MTRLLLLFAFACAFLFTNSIIAQNQSVPLFDFKQSISVFTAHALMNAAGFDGEWRKAGMHPLRIEVRKDLLTCLDSAYGAELHSFYTAHSGGNWSNWASYVLLTKGPPSFDLDYDPATTADGKSTELDMSGLSQVLSGFYVKADIPKLWQKYQRRFQELNDAFRPHAQKALDDIVTYCRLDKDYFSHRASRIHVVFSPLMSYFTAQNDNVNGELYLILGPQVSEPSAADFYHEALHQVLTPLTSRLDSSATSRLADLFVLAKSNGHIGYSHIDEAFVRTMGCVLAGRLFHQPDSTVLANVANEYKLGFILCPAIYEQLKQYEASHMTFAQYFPNFIASIDVEREKARWQDKNLK